MNTFPTVTIIFPTFNGWRDTQACLKSIRKFDYPQIKIETIMIDNDSTDDSVSLARKLFPWVRILPQRKNLGFAKAVNLGIKKAKGKFLLITNNDVVFQKKYLTRLVEYMEKNPGVGIVGGKVYYKKPKNRIAFPGAKFDFYTGLLRAHKNPHKISETDWVPGCNMLVKKEVFQKIGGFDEKFFFYFEDLDLCLRAKRAGYKVIYYPRAILWHGEGASIGRERWQKKSEFYYYGKTRILYKYANRIQLISALFFQFFLGLPFHLLVLKHQNYMPAIKALFEVLKNEKS